MRLTISYPTLPLRNSVRASQVMDHFGISHEAQDRVLASDLVIPLRSGDVVLFTGASGSGKSSLLNALVRRLEEDSPRRHGGTEGEGGVGRVFRHSVSNPSASPQQGDCVSPFSSVVNPPCFA